MAPMLLTKPEGTTIIFSLGPHAHPPAKLARTAFQNDVMNENEKKLAAKLSNELLMVMTTWREKCIFWQTFSNFSGPPSLYCCKALVPSSSRVLLNLPEGFNGQTNVDSIIGSSSGCSWETLPQKLNFALPIWARPRAKAGHLDPR